MRQRGMDANSIESKLPRIRRNIIKGDDYLEVATYPHGLLMAKHINYINGVEEAAERVDGVGGPLTRKYGSLILTSGERIVALHSYAQLIELIGPTVVDED